MFEEYYLHIIIQKMMIKWGENKYREGSDKNEKKMKYEELET